MNITTRHTLLIKVQRQLILFTVISLTTILSFVYIEFSKDIDGIKSSEEASFIVLLVLTCGLIGGFVSIQQRLGNLSDDELLHLASSWASILLVPIYGAVFSLVLHIIFMTDIINGAFFPSYVLPEFSTPPTLEEFKSFFNAVLPASGQDTAKMLFWSFAAGFSERLVPGIVNQIENQVSEQSKGSTEQ